MQYYDINTKEFNDQNTLFFIRKKGKKDFFKNVYNYKVLNQLFPHFETFKTISEYPNADYYINLNKVKIQHLTTNDYEIYNDVIKCNLSKIIFKCRGLRGIAFEEAKELTLICSKFWINFFENYNYKLIVIHIIDNYVLDILYRIANVKGVKIIVLSEFFVYGYRRHTIYGEINKHENPIESNISDFINYFEKKEKSFWLNGFNNTHNLKLFTYLYFSYYARYIIRYIFNFKILGRINYDYRFAHLIGRIQIKNIFSLTLFNSLNISELNINKENTAYLPLHIFPEANVDYWINNEADSDYYSSIFEVLTFMKEKNVTVYIKEHPGFLFIRDYEFYKKIKLYPNVRLINPFDKNCSLLERIDNILIWHGSAGIEGLMQNKNVYVYDYNYYSYEYLQTIKNFGKKIDFSIEKKQKFIEKILHGVVKFNMND
jgi:hypothetical protein